MQNRNVRLMIRNLVFGQRFNVNLQKLMKTENHRTNEKRKSNGTHNSRKFLNLRFSDVSIFRCVQKFRYGSSHLSDVAHKAIRVMRHDEKKCLRAGEPYR